MMDAGRDAVGSAMTTCSKKTTQSERDTCKATSVKDAMMTAMGGIEDEFDAADVEDFVMAAAKDKLGSTMAACMKSTSIDEAGRMACRDQSATTALAESLGKDPAAILPAEIGIFLRKAGKTQTASKMVSCTKAAEALTTGASAITAARGDCKNLVKTELAKSLGLTASEGPSRTCINIHVPASIYMYLHQYTCTCINIHVPASF